MLKDTELDAHQKQFLAEKRREFNTLHAETANRDDSSFPAKALLCGKCQTKAVVLMDGCMTCLNCGESKCG
jgi:hypothetical protein